MQGHEVCMEVLDTESGLLHSDTASHELTTFVAYVETAGNEGIDWTTTQPHDGLSPTDLHAVHLFAQLAWITSDTIGCQTRLDTSGTAWLLVCWVCGGGAEDSSQWPAHLSPPSGTNHCYLTPTQTFPSQTLPVETDTALPTSVPDTLQPAAPNSTAVPPTYLPATAEPASKAYPTPTPLLPADTAAPPYTPPDIAPVRVQTAFWTTIGMKISSAWPGSNEEQTAWVGRFVRTLKDSWSSGVGYPLGLEVTLICPLMQGSEKVCTATTTATAPTPHSPSATLQDATAASSTRTQVK